MIAAIHTTTPMEALKQHDAIVYGWNHPHSVRLSHCEGDQTQMKCKATMTVYYGGCGGGVCLTLPIVCEWQERAVRVHDSDQYRIIES